MLWTMYYEWGWTWLPKPPEREWHILLLDGMEEPPFPMRGYVQIITRLPSGLCDAGYHHALGACPVHQPLDVHPFYAARQASQQMSPACADAFLRDLFR